MSRSGPLNLGFTGVYFEAMSGGATTGTTAIADVDHPTLGPDLVAIAQALEKGETLDGRRNRPE